MHLGPLLAPTIALTAVASFAANADGIKDETSPPASAGAWTQLETGLELGVFPGPSPVPGDAKIWVVRLDPATFDLRLLNASARDARPRTVRDWVLSAGAVAGINAAMFQTDGLTSLGLMRTRQHTNNPRRISRFKAALAFDPIRPELPRTRLLDADCGELDPFPPPYFSIIQSIRMVSCDRRNVWAPDALRKSAAAVGMDGTGHTLFIHARSQWSVHELIDTLLALPIDLRRAMYVEGGPEAQLYARGSGREIDRLGAFEGAAQSSEPGLAWEIPNALVAMRRR